MKDNNYWASLHPLEVGGKAGTSESLS